MAVDIDAGIAAGLGRIIQSDAKAMAKIVPNAAVRAARGARQSLRRAIKAHFGRHMAKGGKAFAETIPAIPQALTDLGGGRFGARVRTKAFFRHRRGIAFDLFWLFENSPKTIVSGRGRMLAIPLPGAKLPLVGAGMTRKLPWPRDLMAKGWKLKILPAGQGGVKSTLIMGGPPGTKNKDMKPLYVLKKAVVIKKKLDIKKTADRFEKRIPRYIEAGMKRFERRVSGVRSIAA